MFIHLSHIFIHLSKPSNLGMLQHPAVFAREFWGILEDNRNPRMAGTPAIGAIERVAGGCQLTSARADMLKSKRISLDLFFSKG